MKATFNLIDQGWLPCVTRDGETTRMGLLDALAQAHDFSGVIDSSPLATVALHRLLLAVLHRVFGPESPEAWGELWRDGRGKWDEHRLRDYLCSAEIYSRFDLFDQRHPFYQTASPTTLRTPSRRLPGARSEGWLDWQPGYSTNLYIDRVSRPTSYLSHATRKSHSEQGPLASQAACEL